MKTIRFHLVVALLLCVAVTMTGWWLLTAHEANWKPWLANWLLAVNLLAFGYYAVDKALAQRSLRRIPEVVLHALALCGGSPAAFLAMWVFRHKTIKTSFRILFWTIVVLQFALLAYVVK